MRRSGHRVYARRRRGIRRILGGLLIVGAFGVGIAAAVGYLPSLLGYGSSPAPTPSSSGTTQGPRCPTARIGGGAHLGTVAWVRDGVLRLLDLDTCRERTLVQTGASSPVRFSGDGRWVAFGTGGIVPADGGQVLSPIGELSAWEWSPTTDLLAGVTPRGGVVLGGPDQARRTLMPDGAGAGHLAFSPNGMSLAVDVGDDQVQVLDLADRSATTVYRVTPGTKAPPQVAGWSPDGRWILFWSRFSGKPGVPLNAAPAAGGSWVNVFDPVLPYDDFLSWCTTELVLSGGAARSPSEGSQILVSAPPGWRFANLSQDFSRSWIWPACSPDGRWIAATATPSHPETPPGYGARSLWLLSADGKHRARLTDSTDAAYEAPRWSGDGRFVLVVRRGLDPDSPGILVGFRIDPSSGKARRAPGTVVRLGPAPGERGHTGWSMMSDWYRVG